MVTAPRDSQATTAQVWDWLQQVPDPEVPVLSVVDLGIVRAVDLEQGERATECVVTITPTYSGCPAMGVIADEIGRVLRGQGLERVRVETRLSPAWTTDWMSEAGRKKLKGYGIAPPAQQAIDISGISRRNRAAPVACPHCGSANTVCLSAFGSTACKALYRCNACLEPFDYFKPH
ncbi:MAG: 1,2-phenylacetyl-CoA epoxidase subunit PaaD [Noviherbaspirillum sp.]